MPASLPLTVTVTVLPLQIVGAAGLTAGVANGKALIVTLTAVDAEELQPVKVCTTV